MLSLVDSAHFPNDDSLPLQIFPCLLWATAPCTTRKWSTNAPPTPRQKRDEWPDREEKAGVLLKNKNCLNLYQVMNVFTINVTKRTVLNFSALDRQRRHDATKNTMSIFSCLGKCSHHPPKLFTKSVSAKEVNCLFRSLPVWWLTFIEYSSSSLRSNDCSFLESRFNK